MSRWKGDRRAKRKGHVLDLPLGLVQEIKPKLGVGLLEWLLFGPDFGPVWWVLGWSLSSKMCGSWAQQSTN